MGARWRKPFFTLIRRDPDTGDAAEAVEVEKERRRWGSPRMCGKLTGIFTGGGGGGGSNPSTPRLSSTPIFRCQPSQSDVSPRSAADGAAKSPQRLFHLASSEPSSPRSPFRFALFKANSLLSRSRCGVCSERLKTTGSHVNRGPATFTADCSHAFHCSCIDAAVVSCCPVCSASWHRPPLPPTPPSIRGNIDPNSNSKAPKIKVYDDDEPLLLSNTSGGISSAVRFNPIPEVESETETEAETVAVESVTTSPLGGVNISVMPEAAYVSGDRTHHNYVFAVKLKAPPPTPTTNTAAAPVSPPLLDPSRRAPIDLVTVLDVGRSTTPSKLHTLKRAMRVLVSSMGPGDRLSVVAFSDTAAKRILPLHRMSRHGRRLAAQIIDRLIVSSNSNPDSNSNFTTNAAHALKKATKVLEDRRDRNPVATIMLLSDGQHSRCVRPSKFAHLEIPIPSGTENSFAGCIGPLNVFLQDVVLQFAFPSGEISAVYSRSGRAAVAFGGGSIRLGDLQVGEERELLVEVRVAAKSRGNIGVFPMCVRCSFRDGASQKPLVKPPLQFQLRGGNNSSSSQRLRNMFVATRSMAESRRLVELEELGAAAHLLSSARSLLLKSVDDVECRNLLHSLEAEIANLRRYFSPSQRRGGPTDVVDGKESLLTPTSAWRAAERLAKLAVMRKSLNRISDLHGFEDARF